MKNLKIILSLLNLSDADPLILLTINCPYLLVTDDPFTPEEIQNAIKQIEPDKSGGPSGVPPGCLKSLPVKWIMFLALNFSNVFVTCTFPAKWSLSRMIVLFKKGKSSVCENYRGIAIGDTFSKLFDSVLCSRLHKWFCPDREQAGAQPGRVVLNIYCHFEC